jgi:glycosyltransferase involved in cell wall biosynthesis
MNPLPKKKVILSFGFWRDTKDLPILLDSFKELKEVNPDMELIVAGDSHPNFPDYLGSIKRRYGKIDGVRYTGYVKEDQVMPLFHSSYVVVLPYLTATGSSGVVHLAASFGRPVIITDLEDMKAITKEEGLKMVYYDKGDKEHLKRSIMEVFSDRKGTERMVKQNFDVASKLTFDNIADKYVDILESVASNR